MQTQILQYFWSLNVFTNVHGVKTKPYKHLISPSWLHEPFSCTPTCMNPFNQTTSKQLHLAVGRCALHLRCMTVDCGRKVECLDESHADIEWTCKPHMEEDQLLRNSIVPQLSPCDHFRVRCGFYSYQLVCIMEKGSDNARRCLEVGGKV